MNTCYKAVHKNAFNGEMQSAIIRPNHSQNLCLRYEIGKKTSSKIGKIFVFEKLIAAKTFVRSIPFQSCKFILECDCGELSVKDSRISMWGYNLLETVALVFWGKGGEFDFRIDFKTAVTPLGTCVVDWVTPREIIELGYGGEND